MQPLWGLLIGLTIVAVALCQNNCKQHPQRFSSFQHRYLAVFFLVMFADWLQGITMYDLYRGYVNDQQTINYLFLTGFATSGLVSIFCGRYIDQWGRKKSCVLYCVLEIIINTLEHVNDVRVLYAGRVLGGLSTALLFVSFESWMITEHHKRGFHERLLQDTFSLAHAGNGVVAVLAGIAAQLLKDQYGDIGPFRAAIVVTAIVLIYILTQWPENHGGTTTDTTYSFNSPLMWLGVTQALFESAMYTFVFNWVPALNTPYTGIVFACFMACVAIGGMLFRLYVVGRRMPTNKFGMRAMLLASASLGVVAWSHTHFGVTLVAFLVFELCVGANMANQAALRSEHVPKEQHAAVMHIFRVPLNILTVAGIWSSGNISRTMTICAVAVGIAALAHIRLPHTHKLP